MRLSIFVLTWVWVIAIFNFFSLTSHASQWHFETKTDPFTDKKIVFATAYAVNEPSRSIVIQCEELKFETYIEFGTNLGDRLVPIRYRVDKESPVSERWLVSSSGTAAFASYDRYLARLLMVGNRFIVEAATPRGTPVLVSFDLTGSEESIWRVMKNCGVPRVGMHKRFEGLRLQLALDLELWGPKTINVYKRILSDLRNYSGPMDLSIDQSFALRVQEFYDEQLIKCKDGRLPKVPTWCWNIRIISDPSPNTVIYEAASGNLKREAGKLRIGD